MRVLVLLVGALLCLRLSASEVPANRAANPCPLTIPVDGLQGLFPNRIAALIRFGRQHRISFGVEPMNHMASKVSLNVPSGTVFSVVKAILGSPDSLLVTCLDTVVLIRDRKEAEPDWLGVRIPEFKLSRSSMGIANAALWMRVELATGHSPKGFVGSVLSRPEPSLVGPFDLKSASACVLLCHLVGALPGSTWITGEFNRVGGNGLEESTLDTAPLRKRLSLIEEKTRNGI